LEAQLALPVQLLSLYWLMLLLVQVQELIRRHRHHQLEVLLELELQLLEPPEQLLPSPLPSMT
jgi:hypothetical protein